MTEAIAPPYLKEKDMLGELIEWLGQQDGTKVVPYGFGKPRLPRVSGDRPPSKTRQLFPSRVAPRERG